MPGRKEHHHSIDTCKSFSHFRDNVLVALGSTRNPELSDCVTAYEKIRKYINVFGSHIRRLKIKKATMKSTKTHEKCYCSSKPNLTATKSALRRYRKRPQTRSLTAKLNQKNRQQKKLKQTGSPEQIVRKYAKSEKTKTSGEESESSWERSSETSETSDNDLDGTATSDSDSYSEESSGDETEECNTGSEVSVSGTNSNGSSSERSSTIAAGRKRKRLMIIDSDDDDDEVVGESVDSNSNSPPTTATSTSPIRLSSNEQEKSVGMCTTGEDTTQFLSISLAKTIPGSTNYTATATNVNSLLLINTIPVLSHDAYMEKMYAQKKIKSIMRQEETTELIGITVDELTEVTSDSNSGIPNNHTNCEANTVMEDGQNSQMPLAGRGASVLAGADTPEFVSKSEPKHYLRADSVIPKMTFGQQSSAEANLNLVNSLQQIKEAPQAGVVPVECPTVDLGASDSCGELKVIYSSLQEVHSNNVQSSSSAGNEKHDQKETEYASRTKSIEPAAPAADVITVSKHDDDIGKIAHQPVSVQQTKSETAHTRSSPTQLRKEAPSSEKPKIDQKASVSVKTAESKSRWDVITVKQSESTSKTSDCKLSRRQSSTSKDSSTNTKKDKKLPPRMEIDAERSSSSAQPSSSDKNSAHSIEEGDRQSLSSHERRPNLNPSLSKRIPTHSNRNGDKDWRRNAGGGSRRNTYHMNRLRSSPSRDYRSSHDDGRYRSNESNNYNNVSRGDRRRDGSFHREEQRNYYHHNPRNESFSEQQHSNYEFSPRFHPSEEHQRRAAHHSPAHGNHSPRLYGRNLHHRYGRGGSHSTNFRN